MSEETEYQHMNQQLMALMKQIGLPSRQCLNSKQRKTAQREVVSVHVAAGRPTHLDVKFSVPLVQEPANYTGLHQSGPNHSEPTSMVLEPGGSSWEQALRLLNLTTAWEPRHRGVLHGSFSYHVQAGVTLRVVVSHSRIAAS